MSLACYVHTYVFVSVDDAILVGTSQKPDLEYVRACVRRNCKPWRRSGRTVCDPLCAAHAVRTYHVRCSVVCMSNVTALFAVQKGSGLAAVCHFSMRTHAPTYVDNFLQWLRGHVYVHWLGRDTLWADHAKGKNAPVAPVPPSLHERTYVCCSMLCYVRILHQEAPNFWVRT